MGRSRAPRFQVRRRGALFFAAFPLLLLSGSCGGPSEGEGPAAPGAAPIVISRKNSSQVDPLVASWWTSFFRQCQDAVRGKDPDHLESLLKSVEGRNPPSWAADSLARFHALLRGMKLVKEGKVRARFALGHRDFKEGDLVFFGLRLENHEDGPLALPAPGTKGILQARLRVLDYGVFGERWESKRPLNLPLDKPIALGPGEAKFEGFQPFHASLPRGAVMRAVLFEGNLLLGSILVKGELLPLKSLPAQPTEMRVFPKGYEPIARKPFLTLKRALELGDPRHFPHIFLSAVFMPPALEEKARALLQDAARKHQDRDLGRVAEAALKMLAEKK